MKGYEVMGKKLHCIQRKPETDSGNGKPTVLSAVKEREQEQLVGGGGGGPKGWNRCQVPSQHQRQEVA